MYSLEYEEDVTARIFNLSGRLKRVLKPEHTQQIGNQMLNWDGKDENGKIVPSGLYIITLEKEDIVLRTTVEFLIDEKIFTHSPSTFQTYWAV